MRTLTAVLVLYLSLLPGPASIWAQPSGYAFQKIAAIATPCTPAPGGGFFQFDFEPWSMNSRGEIAFAADFSNTNTNPCAAGATSDGEGLFLSRNGQLSQITRNGLSAPGGGIFTYGVAGNTTISDAGDVAFIYVLDPVFPPELEGFFKGGIYRFSHTSQKLSAVVVPAVTLAPGFGVFQSVGLHASMNNSGAIVFPGVVSTGLGTTTHFGQGIFLAGRGSISKVMVPGDPAPGGGFFDFGFNPWINDGGDVAFGAHVKGEECIDIGSPAGGCGESIYLKKAATGIIESIAHQGDPAPGGGTLLWAWGAVLNNRGQIAFMGELPPKYANRGIFLHSPGGSIAIARPGDAMPGGGHLVTVNPQFQMGQYNLNNRGDVVFNAVLDTNESGLYLYSQSKVTLVARTGTVIPGVGTIASVTTVITGAALNDRGQIAFFAVLADGSGVMLIATPRP